MATTDLNVTSVITNSGWTNATASSLVAIDADVATDGTVNDFISVEITNAPGDFGSQNSIQLHAHAFISGAGTRTKQLVMELRDSAENVLQTHTTGDLTTTPTTYSSPVWTRADSQAVIDGYRYRITITEGGGMPDAVVANVDRMWGVLDYNLAATPRTTAFSGAGVLSTTATLTFNAATAFAAVGTVSTTGALVFQPALAAFRFYEDDAGEAASTPLDAQDTDVEIDIFAGDVAAQLRLRVDETGGGSGAATDDWQLQVSKNSGAYANVDAGSSNVTGPAIVGWDIGTIGATEANSGLLTEEGQPQTLAFKDDGTKVYVLGTAVDTIYQYPLSVAWDISSIGATEANSGVLTEEDGPNALAFSADGLKVYIIGEINQTIYQYPLSVAWDISSIGAVEANSGALSETAFPTGMAFKPDGTKVYIIDIVADAIYQYPLSVAWDVSSIGATEGNSGALSEEGFPHAVAFQSDGTRVYVIGVGNDTIFQYPLSTPWLISSIGATDANSGALSEEGNPFGLAFKDDGTKVYIIGQINDRIYQYPVEEIVSALTDGAATTNRATNGISDPGTGAFVAGVQEANDGLIADHQLTGGDFTEHVFELTVIAADLADADTLDFRLLLNGSPITADVTPRITIAAGVLAATTAFSGTATLATTATLKIPSTMAVAASGSLVTTARLLATTAATGAGTVSTVARLLGTTAFTATGTVSSAATLTVQETTAYTGAAALSTTATLTTQATTAFTATGTLATAATISKQGTAAYTAAGTLASAARLAATTATTGTGTLASTATLKILASTAFAASGTLTTTAGEIAQRTTAFAGAGSVTTAARLLGTTALSAAGTFSTTAILTLPATTAYSAAGTVTSAASLAGATAYAAIGSMATTARLLGTTAFNGAGLLATTGTLSGNELSRTTAFSAAGILSTAATLTIPRVTAANAVGEMSSTARLVEVTVFSASGTLSTDATLTVAASTEFAGAGLLSAAARQVATTAYAAIGTATTAARLKGATALTAAGTFSSAATLTIQAATDYTATATVTMIGTIVTTPDVEIPGVWDGCEHDGDWQAPSIAGRFR